MADARIESDEPYGVPSEQALGRISVEIKHRKKGRQTVSLTTPFPDRALSIAENAFIHGTSFRLVPGSDDDLLLITSPAEGIIVESLVTGAFVVPITLRRGDRLQVRAGFRPERSQGKSSIVFNRVINSASDFRTSPAA